MKHFYLLILSFFLCTTIASATTVKGTIRKTDDFTVGIFVTPSGGNITGTLPLFNITVSLDALGETDPSNAPVPVDVMAFGTATINETIPVEIINGRFVYAYIVQGTASVSWVNNVEYQVFTVIWPEDVDVIGQLVELNDYTGENFGGNSGQALFDIGVNGIFYVDYGDMFYGSNAINIDGGNSSVEADDILPISLVAFDADKFGDRSSHLHWSTASEENGSHFNIQRSIDKKSWTMVGKVNAFGNSQVIRNYEFVDQNVYNGSDARLTVYYRLQMVDIDGQSKISPIESVVFGNGETIGREILAYPNPASDGIQVEWDIDKGNQPTAIELYDIDGKLVYSVDVAPNANQEYLDFGFTNIQSGLYLLRLVNGQEPIESKQIVVQR